MKKISVEKIQDLIKQLDEFNKLDLSKIQLVKNGEPLNIPDKIWEEWRFIGFSNKMFIEMKYWDVTQRTETFRQEFT